MSDKYWDAESAAKRMDELETKLATIKYECAHINARAFKAEAEYSTIFAYCRELEDTISQLTAQVVMQADKLKDISFMGTDAGMMGDTSTFHTGQLRNCIRIAAAALSATAETVEAWKAENAKDIARLNWIEDRKESVYSVWNVERYWLTDGSKNCAERQVFSGWSCGSRLNEEDTARAAIDKAMREAS